VPTAVLKLFAALALALAAPAFAQAPDAPLYTLSDEGWQRHATASGDILTCSVCEDRVQVQIDVGPLLGPKAPYHTNDEFIARHRMKEQQRSLAQALLKRQIPLDSAPALTIEGTGITRLGGIEAVEFVATLDVAPMLSEDTTMVLIHRGHVVKLTLNYFKGSLKDKARKAVDALLASIKFQ